MEGVFGDDSKNRNYRYNLRDAHQSLMATRMRIEDMLPVLDQLDEAGFASLECWVEQRLMHVFVS